jgi:acid phosphatase type 7
MINRLLTLLTVLLPVAVSAQSAVSTATGKGTEIRKPASARIVCGPYLQNVTPTNFTVMWATDIDTVGWVEIAPDDDTNFYYQDRPKYYDLSGCGINPVGKIHKVTVDGLEPGTKYRYRVMMTAVEGYYKGSVPVYGSSSGTNVYSKKPLEARTLDEEYKEVNFAVVNDVHANEFLFSKLFEDKGTNRGFDFVLFNGDMLSGIEDESMISKNYLKTASELFADEVPLYMARGNHEWRGRDAVKLLDWYDFPDGKPYYTFQYGKFFFLVLDSGEDKVDSDIENHGLLCSEPYLQKESAWLKEVVESDEWKNAERRIVFCHIPPVAKDAWHGNCNVAEYFLPILNNAGTDLMLSGHEHVYDFRKAGTVGADFPVIVNAKCERMDIRLSSRKITVRIYNPDGDLAHSLDL